MQEVHEQVQQTLSKILDNKTQDYFAEEHNAVEYVKLRHKVIALPQDKDAVLAKTLLNLLPALSTCLQYKPKNAMQDLLDEQLNEATLDCICNYIPRTLNNIQRNIEIKGKAFIDIEKVVRGSYIDITTAKLLSVEDEVTPDDIAELMIHIRYIIGELTVKFKDPVHLDLRAVVNLYCELILATNRNQMIAEYQEMLSKFTDITINGISDAAVAKLVEELRDSLSPY